jgi:DNA invertase Pin-like site-specific DNA recombinase
MGVRFVAINNGIDNANPDSTEFSGILNIMNDWYLHDLSRKVRSSAQLRGKAGITLAANPCFGYVKDPGDKNRWLIDPEAAQTIRRIYELAAAGGSQVSICRTSTRMMPITATSSIFSTGFATAPPWPLLTGSPPGWAGQ